MIVQSIGLLDDLDRNEYLCVDNIKIFILLTNKKL